MAMKNKKEMKKQKRRESNVILGNVKILSEDSLLRIF